MIFREKRLWRIYWLGRLLANLHSCRYVSVYRRPHDNIPVSLGPVAVLAHCKSCQSIQTGVMVAHMRHLLLIYVLLLTIVFFALLAQVAFTVCLLQSVVVSMPGMVIVPDDAHSHSTQPACETCQ